jgi:hypothetical protein
MSGSGGPVGAGLSGETSCVFAKALLAGVADCECSRRTVQGEGLAVECTRALARTNCATLLALLRERCRFALKLPTGAAPMIHMQALRLQCGGLSALREVLHEGHGGHDRDARDVHQLLLAARDRHASWIDLPWAELVPKVMAWQPPRRRRPGAGP